MLNKISAEELYSRLLKLISQNKTGSITFELYGIKVIINTTDTVGITLQSWLKQYFLINNIYFGEPTNTQEFPDFFLDINNPHISMLEVKAFNYLATPAFDIANFDSYCESLKYNPYRLDANYLIFGYTMSKNGEIKIEKIWLKKIWEIAGTSKQFPLKTQIKRGIIYNIRPNSEFKFDKNPPFRNKMDFLKALHKTISLYKGSSFAQKWLEEFSKNYENYYHSKLSL